MYISQLLFANPLTEALESALLKMEDYDGIIP